MRLVKTVKAGRQSIDILKDGPRYIVSECITLYIKPRIGTTGRWTIAPTLEQAESIAKDWTK